MAAPILDFVGFGIAGAAIGNQIGPHGFIINDGTVNGAIVGMAPGIGAGLP